MDYICDSVNTVTKAKQMAKNLDIILKTGGFRVKGWISNKSLEDHAQIEKPHRWRYSEEMLRRRSLE